MKKQIEQVTLFHKLYGVPISDKPCVPDKKRRKLRIRLLKEELKEFKRASKKKDLIECADALADLLYVLLGTVLEYGYQNVFEKMFDEVHLSNLSKLDYNNEPILRSDGKVIKGPRYSKPNLKKFLN